MAGRSFEFITETGKPGRHDPETRSKVRSYAMSRYRQLQKEGKAAPTPSSSRQYSPSISQASHQAWRQRRQRSESSRSDRSTEDDDSDSSSEGQSGETPDAAQEQPSNESTRQQQAQYEAFYDYVIALVNSQSLFDPLLSSTPTEDKKQRYRMLSINFFIQNWLRTALALDTNAAWAHFRAPASRTIEAAADAISLLQLGGQVQDAYIVQEAHRYHSAATLYARTDLRVPEDLDSQLVARSVLLLCEMYKEVGSGFQALRGHLSALGTLVEAIASRGHPTRSTRLFFQQARHCILLYSLVYGKPMANEDIWQVCSVVAVQRHCAEVMQLALRVPSTLKRASDIYSSADAMYDEERVTQARAHLLHLELDLDAYDNPQSRAFWRQTSSGIIFHSVSRASQCVLCWICLLLVRQALFRLPDLDRDSEAKRMLIERTDDCADLIHGSLQYLWHYGGGILNKALGVRAPIYFLLRYYECRNNQSMAEALHGWEADFREAVPYLSWDSLLAFSLSAVYLLE